MAAGLARARRQEKESLGFHRYSARLCVVAGFLVLPIPSCLASSCAYLFHTRRASARILGTGHFNECLCKQLLDGDTTILPHSRRGAFAVQRRDVVDSPRATHNG